MGALLIFIFISVLIVSALLFFNKGEKAQEIKSILKDIYKNFEELFSNLKKLFLILKGLIQEKLDAEPTQLKDESSSDDSPKSESLKESKSLSSIELEASTDDASADLTQSQPEVTTNTDIAPSIELEASTDDASNENIKDSKDE